jgi:hypothetical protein
MAERTDKAIGDALPENGGGIGVFRAFSAAQRDQSGGLRLRKRRPFMLRFAADHNAVRSEFKLGSIVHNSDSIFKQNNWGQNDYSGGCL